MSKLERAKKICSASDKGFGGQSWSHEYRKITVGELLSSLEKNGDLLVQRDCWLAQLEIPEYQRDNIWPPDYKEGLIRSIFRGVPIEALKVVSAGGSPSAFRLIDGLQRTSSLLEFAENGFGVTDLFSSGNQIKTYFSAQKEAASSTSDFLDPRSQELFLSYQLDVLLVELPPGSREDLQEKERLLFSSIQASAPQNVSEQIFFLGCSGRESDNFWSEVISLSERLSPLLDDVIAPTRAMRGDTTRYLALLAGLLAAEAVLPDGEGQIHPVFKPLNYERMQRLKRNLPSFYSRYCRQRDRIVNFLEVFCRKAQKKQPEKVDPERFCQIYKEIRTLPTGGLNLVPDEKLSFLLSYRDFFDLLLAKPDYLSHLILRLQEALGQKNGLALNEWRDSLFNVEALLGPFFGEEPGLEEKAQAASQSVEEFVSLYCWEEKTLLAAKRKRAEKILRKLKDLKNGE